MDNPQFDGNLREIESRTELPFDEAQWRLMARRLDSYEKNKKAAPFWMRASYGGRWAAAAAVLLIALGGAWLLSHDSKVGKEPVTAVTAPRVAQPPAPEENILPEQSAEPPAARAPQVSSHANRGFVHRRPFLRTTKESLRTPAPQAQPSGLMVSTAPQRNEQRLEERQEAVLPGRQPVVIRQDQPWQPARRAEDPFKDEPLLASAGKTFFDVNGGYGGGSGAKNNFALGVAVKRNLSPRLQVEAGVGVVSGEYDTYNTITVATVAPGATGDPFGPANTLSTKTQLQEVTERVAYLQATPSVSYRVAGGLALGGGVDAQRRISGASPKSDEGVFQMSPDSYAMEEPGPQPEWDFGLTASADYTIFRKLTLGVMYRESVGTTSTTGKKAAGRNYMLVQLGFRLF